MTAWEYKTLVVAYPFRRHGGIAECVDRESWELIQVV